MFKRKKKTVEAGSPQHSDDTFREPTPTDIIRTDLIGILEGFYEKGHTKSIFHTRSGNEDGKGIIQPVSDTLAPEDILEREEIYMKDLLSCAFYSSQISDAYYSPSQAQTSTMGLQPLPNGRSRMVLMEFLPSVNGANSLTCEVFTSRHPKEEAELLTKVALLGEEKAYGKLWKLKHDVKKSSLKERLEFQSCSKEKVLKDLRYVLF